MFMKQILFSVALAEDKGYTFLQKVLVHLRLALHNDDLGVSRNLANTLELEKFYISFKIILYGSASASACS